MRQAVEEVIRSASGRPSKERLSCGHVIDARELAPGKHVRNCAECGPGKEKRRTDGGVWLTKEEADLVWRNLNPEDRTRPAFTPAGVLMSLMKKLEESCS